jgi:hypothetical protein
MNFIAALILTVMCEGAAIYALRGVFGIKGNPIPLSIVPSLITLPFVWFFFPYVLQPGISLPFSELFAVLVEAPIIRALSGLEKKDSLALSLICNSFSFCAGEIVRMPL